METSVPPDRSLPEPSHFSWLQRALPRTALMSSALVICPGVGMRPSLSGAAIIARSCASDAETSGRNVRTSGRGWPFTAFAISCTTVSSLFGRSPVSISKKTTPRE